MSMFYYSAADAVPIATSNMNTFISEMALLGCLMLSAGLLTVIGIHIFEYFDYKSRKRS